MDTCQLGLSHRTGQDWKLLAALTFPWQPLCCPINTGARWLLYHLTLTWWLLYHLTLTYTSASPRAQLQTRHPPPRGPKRSSQDWKVLVALTFPWQPLHSQTNTRALCLLLHGTITYTMITNLCREQIHHKLCQQWLPGKSGQVWKLWQPSPCFGSCFTTPQILELCAVSCTYG